MKKLVYLLLLVIPFTVYSQEKEVVSGRVVFTCDVKTAPMEKGGYKLIEETKDTNGYVVSYYGANNAKIIVKNSEDKIVGIGKAKEDGTFSISVKPDSFYTFEVSFLTLEGEEAISSDDAKNVNFSLGKINGMYMMRLLGII